ncbi:MAG: hypothetical protein ABJE95_34345 [Byssovorax sp.]
MILRRITRKIALLIAILVPGALGLACPAKDLDIAITARGVAFLTLSCTPPAACTDKLAAVCMKSKACEWDGAVCRGACRIPGTAPISLTGLHDLQVLLFSSNPSKFQKQSACVAVRPCPADDFQCLRDSLNEAVAASIDAGADLTFSGFKDPSDGFAALAIFERPASATSDEAPSCASDRLVACAGLDVPLDEAKLDLECSSCQNGAHTAIGESTRPCPAAPLNTKDCFLRTCFSALGGTITE